MFNLIRVFKLFTVIFLSYNIFLSSAFASVNFMQADRFACSDGVNYDVLRSYSGGYSEGSWAVEALCHAGTLSSRSYDIFFVDKDHPEVNDCVLQNTERLRKCMDEFVLLNGAKGRGSLPPIIHGRQTRPEREPVIMDEGEWANPGKIIE